MNITIPGDAHMNVYPRNARGLSVAVSAGAMLLSSQSGLGQEGPGLPFDEAQRRRVRGQNGNTRRG